MRRMRLAMGLAAIVCIAAASPEDHAALHDAFADGVSANLGVGGMSARTGVTNWQGSDCASTFSAPLFGRPRSWTVDWSAVSQVRSSGPLVEENTGVFVYGRFSAAPTEQDPVVDSGAVQFYFASEDKARDVLERFQALKVACKPG